MEAEGAWTFSLAYLAASIFVPLSQVVCLLVTWSLRYKMGYDIGYNRGRLDEKEAWLAKSTERNTGG